MALINNVYRDILRSGLTINLFLEECISIFLLLLLLLLLFSKRVQLLKTAYKYGQYCTPLTQSDFRYFFVFAITEVTIFTNF